MYQKKACLRPQDQTEHESWVTQAQDEGRLPDSRLSRRFEAGFTVEVTGTEVNLDTNERTSFTQTVVNPLREWTRELKDAACFLILNMYGLLYFMNRPQRPKKLIRKRSVSVELPSEQEHQLCGMKEDEVLRSIRYNRA